MVPFLIKPLLLAGYITEIACIQVCPVTCNRPPSLAQLSVLADIAGYLVFGFVINIGALFGSRAFGFISGLSTPMTRALISKHTPKNEQVWSGRLCSLHPGLTACREASSRRWPCLRRPRTLRAHTSSTAYTPPRWESMQASHLRRRQVALVMRRSPSHTCSTAHRVSGPGQPGTCPQEQPRRVPGWRDR